MASDHPYSGDAGNESAIEFKGGDKNAESKAVSPISSSESAPPEKPTETPAQFEIAWVDEEQLAPQGRIFSQPPPEPLPQDFEIVRDPTAPPHPYLRLPLPRVHHASEKLKHSVPSVEHKAVTKPAYTAEHPRPHRAPFLVRFAWAFMPLLLFIAGYAAVVFTQNKIGYSWDEAYYYKPAVRAGTWILELIAGENPIDSATIDQYWEERHEHPSTQKLLSGLALRLFSHSREHLYAMRLPMAILFGLTLTLLYLLGRRMLGPVPGLMTALMYAVMPQIFGYAHFATMETPLVFFVLLTVWCFLRGLDSPFWSVMTGISFGLLLATKINGFFLPIPLIIWGHLYARQRYVNNLFAILILGPLVFVATWPWLWHDTILRLLEYLKFHAQHQKTAVFFMRRVWGLNCPNAPWFYPLVMICVSLPLSTLTFILWGLVPVLTRPHRRPLGTLYLLCALVFLAVACAPGAPRYDGVRLFLPVFAFLALIGGGGFVHMMFWVEEGLRRAGRKREFFHRFGRLVAVLFGFVILIEGGSACLHYYPYLLSYFNPLVGGVRGADARGYEVAYWNDALNEDVIEFLNSLPSTAGRPIRIRALAMHELCLDHLQAWGLLNPDIDFHAPPPYDYHLLQFRRGMFGRPERALADTDKFPLVHAWGLDGVPLLALYQTGPAFEQYWPQMSK